MWGIPARSWGSQEYNALAGRIDECRTIHLQAGRRAESNQCVGLADYVRRQFGLPRKDAEDNDRKAQAIKELERQNRAVLEREESVRKAEAEANDARAKAEQLENVERQRKDAIADHEAQTEQRKQEDTVTTKADVDAKVRIEQAKRLKMEAEVREQTAKARLQASDDAKAKALSDKVAAANFELRNFITRNPGLIEQPQEQMKSLLLEFYSVKVAIEFCQHDSSVFNSGYFGSYSNQLTEINRRTKLMEDVATQMLDTPLDDIRKMTGPDGTSLQNTRIVDELQANKSDTKQLCDEGLAHLSRLFNFNH
jgi:DNA repair exonuclease SbcCD ATPase subunit